MLIRIFWKALGLLGGGNKAGSLVPSFSWSKTIPPLFCLMLPAELSLALKQEPWATAGTEDAMIHLLQDEKYLN